MIELNPNEAVLKQAKTVYLKSSYNAISGTLYVTNQRVVFYQPMVSRYELIRLLKLLSPNTRGGILLNVPLETVTLAKGAFGAFKTLLVFNLADGSSFKMMAEYDDWAPLILKAQANAKNELAV